MVGDPEQEIAHLRMGDRGAQARRVVLRQEVGKAAFRDLRPGEFGRGANKFAQRGAQRGGSSRGAAGGARQREYHPQAGTILLEAHFPAVQMGDGGGER